MDVDDSEVQKNLQLLLQQAEKNTKQAVSDVATEIMRLSQQIVPIGTHMHRDKSASLQNSGTVEPKQPALEMIVGYNTVYAAYQHEGRRKDGTHVVKNYSNPRSKPKFLETPIKENMSKWKQFFQKRLGGSFAG